MKDLIKLELSTAHGSPSSSPFDGQDRNRPRAKASLFKGRLLKKFGPQMEGRLFGTLSQGGRPAAWDPSARSVMLTYLRFSRSSVAFVSLATWASCDRQQPGRVT